VKKRQRDLIISSLRQKELSSVEVETSDVAGDGYIAGNIFQMTRSIIASNNNPASATMVKAQYEKIVQWAIYGITNANKAEAEYGDAA